MIFFKCVGNFKFQISNSKKKIKLKIKGDGNITLRLFKPGFLKPIGHQNGFCLDLQDRERILEPSEA
jgi:hypothetical protein